MGRALSLVCEFKLVVVELEHRLRSTIVPGCFCHLALLSLDLIVDWQELQHQGLRLLILTLVTLQCMHVTYSQHLFKRPVNCSHRSIFVFHL